jgi:hypothetical protein
VYSVSNTSKFDRLVIDWLVEEAEGMKLYKNDNITEAITCIERLELWWLMSLSTIFLLYLDGQFYW